MGPPSFAEVCLLTVTSQGSLQPWLLDDGIQKLLVLIHNQINGVLIPGSQQPVVEFQD